MHAPRSQYVAQRRKLYLKRGYSSMFVYCTSHLRLSEPAAARRIRTARCLARFPELYDLLEAGEVNLSTVSMVAKFMKPGNANAVLVRIRGKSRREVEQVVAELEPRAMLPPDRVRTVVVPAAAPAGWRVTVAGDSEIAPTVEISAQSMTSRKSSRLCRKPNGARSSSSLRARTS